MLNPAHVAETLTWSKH